MGFPLRDLGWEKNIRASKPKNFSHKEEKQTQKLTVETKLRRKRELQKTENQHLQNIQFL